MNHFLLSPEERIRHWRNFRLQLDQYTETQQLQQIIDYWAVAPITNIVLDPWNHKDWPTPWEVLSWGKYCQNAIGFMMEQSLILTASGAWNPDRVQLALIRDRDAQIENLVVIIDSKLLLNYTYGSIENLEDSNNIEIINRFIWSPSTKKHVEIRY